jgi:predicted nucleotidyltransferase
MRLADASEIVHRQLGAVVDAAREILGDELVGVYLHGSLAMGGFNPSESDLDLLAVVRRPMTDDEKRRLWARLSRISGRKHHRSRRPLPRSIEMSFLTREQLDAWEHPARYEFRWAEHWRFRHPADRRDPDLATHVVIARTHGVALHGPPPAEVLPDVPRADYVDSALTHVDGNLAGRHVGMDVLLNAGRAMAAVVDGVVFSKEEGGRWLLERAPAELHGVVAAALAAYLGEGDESRLDRAALARFAEWWTAWRRSV